jgi:single-strand DNA-binding protein
MLINSWHGTGRLGQDAQLNYTPTGKAVGRFSIAVDQGKDQKAMWLTIITWEKLAERVCERARKGDEVFVEGRLVIRPYQDRNGQERQSIEIVATSVQLTQRPTVTASLPAEIDPLGTLDDHAF